MRYMRYMSYVLYCRVACRMFVPHVIIVALYIPTMHYLPTLLLTTLVHASNSMFCITLLKTT